MFLADLLLHMVANMGAGMVSDKVSGMVVDKKNIVLG